MRSILREQRRSSMAAAAITVMVGLLLLLWPNRSVNLMCMILGLAVTVTGIIYVLGWFVRRREGAPAFYVLPGVILIALGLWLFTRPESLVRLIQYIFGAILIFHGVVDLQGAVALIRQSVERWWLDLLLTVLTIALGVIVLINPFGTFAALVMLMGAALIFDGVSDFYLIWRLTRAMKDFDENGNW